MRRLILNSSQSKHPIGNSRWIKSTLRAVDVSVQGGYEIVASIGLPCWEVTLWRSAVQGARIHLVCPLPPGIERNAWMDSITASFALPRDRTRWHWVAASGRSRKSGWAARDEMALALADEVLPVSVRPHGRLATLLRTCPAKIVSDHVVAFERANRSPRWERRLPAQVPDLWPSGSLVHLTRGSDGPWPGEPSWKYYEDVVSSGESDARSAYETLRRIVDEGVIRGTSFRARGGEARVCFSACTASEALGLVRYRARYGRYAFEPYGVVLSPRIAERIGMPVSYGSLERGDWLGQGEGEGGHWRREREWRVMGDVDLGVLDPGEVRLVTATQEEARRLGARSRYAVMSFGCAEVSEENDRRVEPQRWCAASKEL